MKTAGDILNDKKRDMVTIRPDQTIREALERMQVNRIGAILVKRGEKIVGIWSERDLARDILKQGFDIDTALVENHMSTRLYTAPDDTPILKLQEMFLGLFIRHILITHRRKTVGLLSIGDVMRAGLLEKDTQIRDLTAMASWEYYENWGWDRKLKAPRK
ncbi:MAG TPA: CBS domain-containing protein [Desulfobacterales bacterium]|jgi:signal-transduction protein with cAMP-binding, CBS, and nucleotidyltransferase domain|nr:CBS domain-containing protein [Desulfobacterales bacterium]